MKRSRDLATSETLEVFEALRCRWAALDAASLSEEGLRWSEAVGLRYVTPDKALNCLPLKQNELCDGADPIYPYMPPYYIH